jgi:type I restriction enzyme S subunit
VTPRELIDAFEVVAEAPDGVKRLRELVLQLAVRGKLVPQDAGDEPVGALLGKRGFSPGADDTPFDVPATWAWSTLSRLGEVCGGGTPDKQNSAYWNGSIPWVSPKDMKRDYIGDSQDHITREAVAGSAVKSIPPGSLLMVVRGMILAHSFPTALTTVEVTVNQDMKALLPFSADLAPYLLVATKALKPEILALVDRSTHGTCKLSTDRLFVFPLPIPPLAEQHRIVARVDEFMGLLDRLEAARKDRDATRDAARDSALAALRDADTPDEVEVAWNRIAGRMAELFTRPADLEPLRQAVLQLAVRGRLVRQDPNDEPASILAHRLDLERRRRWACDPRRQRAQASYAAPAARPWAPITDSSPVGWSTVSVEGLTDPIRTVSYGILKPGPDISGGVPYVKVRDIKRGVVDCLALHRTTREIHDSYVRSELAQGDVLISIRGTVGKVATVPEGVAGGNITQDSARLALLPGVDREFFVLALRSPALQSYFSEQSKGAAVQGLNIGDLRPAPIPLPPLAEQHRIVAKVDALIALIDQLDARLTAATDLHAQFAAAAVHHLDA